MVPDLFSHKSLQVAGNIRASVSAIDPEVKLSNEMLNQYKYSRSKWAKKGKKWDDFRKGFQLTKEEISAFKKKRQPPLIVNVIKPAVEQAKAMLTTNHPQFSTTGREDSDSRTGKMFSDLLSYVWYISDGNMRLKKAIDEYYVRGMGALMAYVDPFADYGKGEVYITDVDSFDVYVDPNTKDPYGRDASNILIAKVMTNEQISIAYPQYYSRVKDSKTVISDNQPKSEYLDSDGRNNTISDMWHTKHNIIDRYTKVKDLDITVRGNNEDHVFTNEQFQNFLQLPAVAVLVQGQDPQFITDQDTVRDYFKVIQHYGKEIHMEADQTPDPQTGQPSGAPVMASGATSPTMIPGSSQYMEILDMKDLCENGIFKVKQIVVTKIHRVFSIGDVKCYDGIMDIPEYPIVLIMNHHDRTPYPQGDVEMVGDLQMQINKLESLIVTHATNSTNTKIFYPRGSVDKNDYKERWGNAGSEWFEFNPELGGKPEQMYPPPLPNELYKNKSDKIQEVERALGIFAMQQGDSGSAPQTFKGTMAIDEFGQRRIKSKKDDIEGAINALAKVVIKLIQQTYTEEKTIRLIQPNNKPLELQINTSIYDDFGNVVEKINDITVGDYDCIVVSGSMLPSNRWAQFDYYMMMYEKGLIDQVEMLKKTELVDIEGVLNRHSQMQQLQSENQQLQAEIKKLSGDLQTAQREVVHADKRVEVEKFKTNLHKSAESVRASSQVNNQLAKNQLNMFGQNLDFEKKLASMKYQSKLQESSRDY